MNPRNALFFSLLALGCTDPATSGPNQGRDLGPSGAEVAVALALDVRGPLEVVALSIETASVDLLSDREPRDAARLPIDGTLSLENGFDDGVQSAAPGAYSALLLAPMDAAPTLRLVVRLAGVRIQVEASALPLIRVRCPAPVDLADGGALDVTATLDLNGLESILTGALFPPPLGVTELVVTGATHPAIVAQVVNAVVSSWSLTCDLR